jgi:hypothetical protein
MIGPTKLTRGMNDGTARVELRDRMMGHTKLI